MKNDTGIMQARWLWAVRAGHEDGAQGNSSPTLSHESHQHNPLPFHLLYGCWPEEARNGFEDWMGSVATAWISFDWWQWHWHYQDPRKHLTHFPNINRLLPESPSIILSPNHRQSRHISTFPGSSLHKTQINKWQQQSHQAIAKWEKVSESTLNLCSEHYQPLSYQTYSRTEQRRDRYLYTSHNFHWNLQQPYRASMKSEEDQV